MKTGDIILIPFPFSDASHKKVRPALVIGITQDKFKDIITCAITSVVPQKLSKNEILLLPNTQNKLRSVSVIRVDRIITLKKEDVIIPLGHLSKTEIEQFRKIFKSLVD